MRARARARMLASVTRDALRLVLELDPFSEAEPIAGTLRDAAGEAHAFRGWLELCSLLETAREGTPGPGAASPGRPHGV